MIVIQHRPCGPECTYPDTAAQLFAEDIALVQVVQRLGFLCLNFLLIYMIHIFFLVAGDHRIPSWIEFVVHLITVIIVIGAAIGIRHRPTCVPFFNRSVETHPIRALQQP